MQYPIRQIAETMGGQFLQAPADTAIEHLLLDSRQVIFPASSLFIALQGRRFNGHEFIADLYAAGVRNFVVSKKMANHQDFPSANFILVKNTQEAFHALAAFHRRQFRLPVIAITGSNGKTIVKEWLFQLLHEDYHIVRSPKSYNSQTGVPLSVLQITEAHTLGIFEAGISQPGEMDRLERILRPNIGLFTNIGEAHQEGFSDIKTKIQEKLKLFTHCEAIIYCADNELVAAEIKAVYGEMGKQFFTWSATGKAADLQIIAKHQTASTTNVEGTLPNPSFTIYHSPLKIQIPFTDAASIENAINCWALMLYLGIPADTIAERMKRLEPVAMRLELKEGLNGCTVINDSYNSDLTSLGIALNFLEQQSPPRSFGGKKLGRSLILSDILQSGQAPAQLYATVAGLLVEKRIDRLIGIGKQVGQVKAYLPAGFDARFYPSTASLLDDFSSLTFRDEVILLKGARQFGFERIANRLATKFHKTVLEVNLGALLHNLRVYQSQLGPGTKMMVMVKAGAYGSGSTEVAKLLEFQNVDYLGVAYADEGVELRKAGIQLPILVMNPEEATFEALVRYRLEPEVYSLSLLHSFLEFLKTHFAQANGSGVPSPQSAVRSHEPTVTSHELRVTSYESRATSYEPRATSHESRATSHELRVTSYEPRATSHELRVTSYESRAMSHELRVTSHQSPIHLKLDTGMHRLGFEEQDLAALLQLLQPSEGQPGFTVKTIFSHLAASEAPQHDDFTRQQFARFQAMYETLVDGLGYQPMRHILNSGGIVRFPAQQFEMVRLGIGLYGVDSSGILQARLQTVNTLQATISQVKNVPPGETVGYGRLGKAQRPMRIATLSLGYADGLLRRAGNGQFSVLINGQRAPIIGNVCMDMTMVDVTDIPSAKEGGAAIVFGHEPTVQELAACLGTIPYEIFTTISERVKRVYVQE